MEVDPPPAPAPEATPAALPGDSFYAVDETAVDAQRQAKPWTQDATYFKRVAVSPAASTKMLAHAQRGCEAGVKAGGKPLEVMDTSRQCYRGAGARRAPEKRGC